MTAPVWFNDWSTVGVSPGRHWLAMTSPDHLVVYDLANGKTAGTVPLPSADGAGSLFCQGLAFSGDGLELAGLFTAQGKSRIIVWEINHGLVVADHRFPGELKAQVKNTFFYRGRILDWLPGRKGWLVYGQALVNRANGRLMGSIPVDADDLWMGPRKVIEPNHLLLVASAPKGRTVERIALPWPSILRQTSDGLLPPR
jgi:hypothetical protein